jgi:actinin alpha
MFIVHTMEEIQGLLDAHEQFKATLGEADKEYQSIVGLVQQVESIASQHSIPGGLDNPYTSLTAKVKRKKHFYSRAVNSSAADRADNTGSEC